ncbi:MAG: NUDIX hydrolase [Candidatus Moranbacteria bacterium]|nr:NUDIX hydrolase [Candidatus Moranbacteria bacterium]
MEIQRPLSRQPIPDDAKCVFKGTMFDVYQWEQRLFNGSKAIFEKVKRPDTVVVFPILPDGKILLTEQEQPGKEPFIGATGGRVDEGEDVMAAAKRELLEESGYEAEQYILWHAEQPVSKMEWAVYVFIAKGLKKVAGLDLDGGEKITLKPVTFDEFIDLGTQENFSEKEIVFKLLEAKVYPEKKEELQKLFDAIL